MLEYFLTSNLKIFDSYFYLICFFLNVLQDSNTFNNFFSLPTQLTLTSWKSGVGSTACWFYFSACMLIKR
jgi:hypothetical protein